MIIAISIFVIILSGLLIFSVLKNDQDSKSVLVMRKKQNATNFRESALKKKFEQMAEEKVKVTKKYTIETNCLQAGYKLSYGEYKIISISAGIIVPILALIFTNNAILSIMFIPVGYMIPGQYINFMKNRRVSLLDKQVGSFMKLVIERYKSQGDFAKAVEGCLPDFSGQYPIYGELRQTVLDMNLGIPTGEAMEKLALRTGSKYLKRLADFYKITSDLGTKDAKENLLNQAFIQYEENRKVKSLLKKEISGPVREAYIMVSAIPMLIGYQAMTSDTYINFMLNTTIGKVGSAVIVGIIMGSIWFINTQIGKPID